MAGAITDIKGIRVGSYEDPVAMTGCTVILTGKEGCTCGVEVRGAAPGTRETDLLSPLNTVERVHAILLTGGSAYGLDAAGGVMQYLEQQGIGFPVGPTVVPIVPGAVIFDLLVGDSRIRPDREMGYKACLNAGREVREGNAGAGMGATVGKIKGLKYCTKSGQGTAAIKLKNGLMAGALAVVNALGDIINPENGEIVAGARSDDGRSFTSTTEIWKQQAVESGALTNTTIAAVATNAKLSKSEATRVARLAHNALARTINPVHTSLDGDTVFALASGEIEADVNTVGIIAQQALTQAILRAVYHAETIADIRSCRD